MKLMFGECRLLVVSFARQMNVFQIFSISISDLGFFARAASKETLSKSQEAMPQNRKPQIWNGNTENLEYIHLPRKTNY